ncbi:hypothetical protein OAF74_03545, partial [bacterium]|nr:hypothetical protein [bacterium]
TRSGWHDLSAAERNGGRGNCVSGVYRCISFNPALATPITSLRYVLGRATRPGAILTAFLVVRSPPIF